MTEYLEGPQCVAPDTTGAGRRTHDPDPVGELISHQILDVVDGHPPVPIDIWRVADDEPDRATVPGDPSAEIAEGWRCTTRMAQLLVSMFATPATAVISIGFDPVLAGVAGAVGCPYQAVDRLTDLARLAHLADRVGLLLIPWPATGTRGDGPEHPGAPDEDDTGRLADWLGACRTLMADRGVTVVVLAPAPPTDAYVACARLLLPAARRAGLGWLQHIVAITAPVAGLEPDRTQADAVPQPPATRPMAPTTRSDSGSGRGDGRSVLVHADLLAFVLRGGRHG
ncbi:MAG: hypothetical protein HKP61_16875 [Dactylosporangium sp.]|nr:hypothetical protein [Dactylosporangium sp.]NNJ62581.1 hypothetical protein [Dactylosporangium sp.]